MCMQLLLRGNNGRIAWWSVAFITAMFVLNTLVNGLNIRFNTMMFVLYRGGTDGPTGPLEFLETQFSDVISVAGFACYVVGLWMQDGLLVGSSCLCRVLFVTHCFSCTDFSSFSAHDTYGQFCLECFT